MRGEISVFSQDFGFTFKPEDSPFISFYHSQVANVIVSCTMSDIRCMQGGFSLYSKLQAFLEFQESTWKTIVPITFTKRDNLIRVEIIDGLNFIKEAFKGLPYNYSIRVELSHAGIRRNSTYKSVQNPRLVIWRPEQLLSGHARGFVPFFVQDVWCPPSWKRVWNSSKYEFHGRIYVKLYSDEIPDAEAEASATNKFDIQWLVPTDLTCVGKKLLRDSVATDVVIISGDGSSHKCHKSYLIAHSSVFEVMFQGEWKESTANTIKMDDISQDGLDAVLAFLYYSDLDKPFKDFKVACEMLLFANKYAIQCLETVVVKLILRQPDQWFQANTTFNLYVILNTCELPFRVELKKKTIKIMHLKRAELMGLPEFTCLMKENPTIYLESSTALNLRKDI